VVSGSVSFDRAAAYYDETRGLPDDAMAELTTLLAGALDGRRRVLEIGVGTGRIALPLHRAGVPMFGIDLARPMLDVLVGKTAGNPMPIAQADATQLPFPGDAFDAAVASHVFHLIPDSDRAFSELVRVLAPGARILVAGGGADPREEWPGAIHERFRSHCGDARHAEHDERRDAADAQLAAYAAAITDLPTVEVKWHISIAASIDRFESGVFSWTWDTDPEVLHTAGELTREWARETYGDLDEQRVVTADLHWRCYDLR
jgi:SAM-dependent methyltransferase